MSDETIIVKKEETSIPPTLAETQLSMAVEYGRMTQAFQANQTELQEVKSSQATLGSMLSEALQEMRMLRSQTDTTSRHAEQLSESQSAIISAIAENSEKDESKEAIPVTPMETKIEIEQKPANMQKSLLQRIFF